MIAISIGTTFRGFINERRHIHQILGFSVFFEWLKHNYCNAFYVTHQINKFDQMGTWHLYI